MSALRRWRSRVRKLKQEGVALALACRDPRVPWHARVVAALAVGYLFSPIDLIPDFIPIVGYLDDLLVVPLLIVIARRLIPTEILEKHRATARQAGVRAGRIVWLGLTVILLVWLMIAALLVLAVLHVAR